MTAAPIRSSRTAVLAGCAGWNVAIVGLLSHSGASRKEPRGGGELIGPTGILLYGHAHPADAGHPTGPAARDRVVPDHPDRPDRTVGAAATRTRRRPRHDLGAVHRELTDLLTNNGLTHVTVRCAATTRRRGQVPAGPTPGRHHPLIRRSRRRAGPSTWIAAQRGSYAATSEMHLERRRFGPSSPLVRST